jgi:plasmid stabilization system protein ParE
VTRSIRFEPEALRDIAGAARYYDRERRGLGAEFRQAVNRRVLAFRRFPNSGAPVEHVTTSLVARQVRARQFRYLIIYVVTEDVIRVVAVAHEKRLPAFWADRLSGA